MALEQQYKREIARKTMVAELLSADDDFNAKRVSMLATVVDKDGQEAQHKSIVVDDGSGQLKLRFFDNEQLFEKCELGSFVLVIGKPRRYGAETYVAPEILKTVNNVKWAEVRKLELKIAKLNNPPAAEAKNDNVAEDIAEESNFVSKDKLELYRVIKSLDTGQGADVSEVTAKFGNSAESLIREMVKNGDLFEVLPGRLKVLE